ncbi:hypothetical protein PV327_010484 [Microctonus hyperodae]|uniref:Uncharacterized protein n=1 Tax=Microctonus hyperodae TaxID=165561 RepID=A0AA39FS09_MICHY|nr:hypothetical protein PV327_010484 [Microctonus hyperodae]
MFPFPTSSDHLRGNIAMSRSNHPTAEEIIVPNDCYWIAPNIGISMTNIADPNYVTFMDLSHRLNRDWMHPGSMLAQDYSSALIERPTFLFHDNCPVLITPEQSSSFNEKKNTGNTTTSSSNSSINSTAYSLRNNNIINNNSNNSNNNRECDNENRVDSTKKYVKENCQQDLDDDDDNFINVDDIDC